MILDTNALSAWCDGESLLLNVFPTDRPLFLPVIVLGEYRFGIKVARDREIRERWLGAVERAVMVLNLESTTADHYADFQTPIPENDVWIAALTRQHRLPLLSRDAHFDRVPGLRRVGW